MQSLNKLTNEQIVVLLKHKFSNSYFECLLHRFKNLISKIQFQFQIDLFDPDDYVQESRIVLYQSILSYDTSRSTYFASFYQRNLKYHFINIWRYTLAKKRGDGQFNLYLHDNYSNDPSHNHLGDYLLDPYEVPHDTVLIIKEESVSYFAKLSDLEKEVFKCHLEGLEPHEISESCQLDIIQVRNAIDRCRYKLKNHFNQ